MSQEILMEANKQRLNAVLGKLGWYGNNALCTGFLNYAECSVLHSLCIEGNVWE